MSPFFCDALSHLRQLLLWDYFLSLKIHSHQAEELHYARDPLDCCCLQHNRILMGCYSDSENTLLQLGQYWQVNSFFCPNFLITDQSVGNYCHPDFFHYMADCARIKNVRFPTSQKPLTQLIIKISYLFPEARNKIIIRINRTQRFHNDYGMIHWWCFAHLALQKMVTLTIVTYILAVSLLIAKKTHIIEYAYYT